MKQLQLRKQVSPREKVILDNMGKHAQVTNRDLLKNLQKKFGNISRITLIRDLNDLVARGHIIRIGEGRGVKYMCAENKIEHSVPENLKRYFWDTDIKKLSLTRHAIYIIERILEWGDLEAVKWLRRTYSEKMIVEVLNHSRRISDKSANFWKVIFSHHNALPICTQKSWGKQQEKIWKY